MTLRRYREYTRPMHVPADSAWARIVTLRDALIAQGVRELAASRQAFATVTGAAA